MGASELTLPTSISLTSRMDYLLEVVQKLSLARSLDEISYLVRHAARELVNADGATFVLKDDGYCHYVDEDAIGPLWKGKRFPIESCVSGWAMLNNDVAVIDDIYVDPRVPHSAYRPTFVKSLVMTPIRGAQPIGAIGTYWAKNREATTDEIKLLKALANSTSIALENVRVVGDLRKSNEALFQSLQSRDEFLSIAAHELRTPLSALKLQLELTDDDLAPSETALRDDLAMALKQTRKMEQLVEQLLDLSRIRIGRVDLNLTEFTMDEAVQSVLEQNAITLREAKCEVSFGPANDGQRGRWDRLRVEQILTNLISNACKYAPGKPVHISVSHEGSDATVRILDHGPGISAENRERIFDRFVRATSSSQTSGLGLGLSIVKSLAQAHGGDVELTAGLTAELSAEPKTGAEFLLRLPLAPGSKSENDHE
jgi:signal transduction histidine kinase